MGIVNVESRTFERMLARFEEFARRMDALCRAHRIGEPEPWLDNQQVCQLLNISKRTLQTLRSNGSLSYTQINHKICYRTMYDSRIRSIDLKTIDFGRVAYRDAPLDRVTCQPIEPVEIR